ncbi:MAG: glycosyltransferase [Clostridium sp.]|nr:glycosyltransferase [Clostridium sp.]
MKSLVSIIVPIYNIEQYLEQCIQSLINQTYTDIEIILVDDGATDRSGELCDVWAERDTRIKVMHKCNEGVAAARNTGIETASGEWIMFVDGDDYVADSFCEHALLLVQDSNADIGVFNYCFCWEDHTKDSEECVTGTKCSTEALSLLFARHVADYPVNKIYRKELFTEIRYPVGEVWEDLGTTYKLFAKARIINFSKEVLYYYRQRSGSITHTISKDTIYDIYGQYKKMYLFCQENYPQFADMVWDEVVTYALICFIKDYALARQRSTYQELGECLRKDRRVPTKLSHSKKIMLCIYRLSESLFFRICAVVYFLKGA